MKRKSIHQSHKHLHKSKAGTGEARSAHFRAHFSFDIRKFKWIENFWHKHAGEDIWVICPGAQLDEYPDDFFDDKISIGLKSVIRAFPNCTYSMFSLRQRNIKRYVYAGNFPLGRCIIKVFRYDRLVWKEPVYFLNTNVQADQAYYISLPKRILGKGIRQRAPHIYRDNGGILQDGIQAAIILGARRIILAACFHKGVGTRYHAQLRGMDSFYPEKRKPPRLHLIQGKILGQRKDEEGTRWLAQAFRPHKIQILRHHYGKEGFEDLTIKPLTFKERKQLAALEKSSE